MTNIIKGEVVRNEQPVNNYGRAVRLGAIRKELMDLINEVHQMGGPARLELRDTSIIIETPVGNRNAPVDLVIGDIKHACNVLEERLKG